ncbi:hypothetical protein SAMN02910447_03623 [Ruminococcus sp. YE71]|uniref:hypothetical protein n=1 Tax=unclassified Ruminococcus TaxID=2608920 RepID=UPI00088E66A6|nr:MULTISPECIES: hypothetical protein [unclassified Ruminococcus]SDA33193.1 hypothetical protein SAMN02910446_03731 [Ruminococcus sp. YE78]SFW54536.1 hypothetical protein SAMN02910447_03623 [Ruminococcus sp. YE71]
MLCSACGSSTSGSLRLCDARIKDHAALLAAAADKQLTAAQVIDFFTSIKASTAIENDTAKENSLRFTRVVDHYSPIDNDELVFEADYEIDSSYHEQLIRSAKALRNIGNKRIDFEISTRNRMRNTYQLTKTIKFSSNLFIKSIITHSDIFC